MGYDWQKWQNLQNRLYAFIGKEPSEEGILLLLGLDRLGFVPSHLEEKEVRWELLQLGMCVLLEHAGLYRQKGKDAQGWPLFEALTPLPPMTPEGQEGFLRSMMIRYFSEIWEL
ncbi:MAG: hypothetical protein ACUVRD_07645 [Bacteroidia bacterium]